MARILIVDDSEELLEICTHILKFEGYEVETASSKNSLLSHLADPPDIILLDVKLNGDDGRELCRNIKETEPGRHIPIILISASPELLKDYEECKAVAIIEKPFGIETVRETIQAVLGSSKPSSKSTFF